MWHAWLKILKQIFHITVPTRVGKFLPSHNVSKRECPLKCLVFISFCYWKHAMLVEVCAEFGGSKEHSIATWVFSSKNAKIGPVTNDFSALVFAATQLLSNTVCTQWWEGFWWESESKGLEFNDWTNQAVNGFGSGFAALGTFLLGWERVWVKEFCLARSVWIRTGFNNLQQFCQPGDINWRKCLPYTWWLFILQS